MGDTSYETGKSPLATPLAVATVRIYKATALIPSLNKVVYQFQPMGR